jgi:hypothetical protein
MAAQGLDQDTSTDLLGKALMAMSVSTAASGCAFMAAPGFVLRGLGAPDSGGSRHLGATIGMFMVVVGGTLFEALVTDDTDPVPVRWSAAQKLGSAAAMTVGFRRGVFSRSALAVAVFDLASGVLCLADLRRLGRRTTARGR